VVIGKITTDKTHPSRGHSAIAELLGDNTRAERACVNVMATRHANLYDVR